MNKFRMFPPLLGLVFLLAGCGDSRPAETVRLVTYNAGTFNKYIADDYPLVAEMMREVGADAVCLNELDSCSKSGCLRKADRPGTGTLADTNNYRYRRLRLSYFRPGNRK